MDARRWLPGLLLCGAVLAWGVTASATPLNLQNGDLIDTIAWDALRANGDSGVYTWDGSSGSVATNGLISSVSVERSPAFPPTLTVVDTTGLNVEFVFNADLIAYSQVGTFANVTFGPSASANPDVTVLQNGNVILTGDFMGNFVFGGDITQPALVSIGYISVTGGDAALVAAIGAVARLNLSATVGNFIPSLAVLGADGNLANSNFTMEFSGTLRPQNAAPFVPEPGTAILGAAGALGLLTFARRAGRR